jgi:hypothetical protein
MAVAGDEQLQSVTATREVVARPHARYAREHPVKLRVAAKARGQRRVQEIPVPTLHQRQEVSEPRARTLLDEAHTQIAAEAARQ